MKDKITYSLPQQVSLLLEAGRFKDSFTLLRRRLVETPVQGALATVAHAENTYRLMLDFFAKGYADPERDRMKASIRRSLLDIAQKIDKENAAADSPELFFSTLRMCRLRPSAVQDSVKRIIQLKAESDFAISAGQYPFSIMQQIEAEEEKLFNQVWTADSLSQDDYMAIEEASDSNQLPFTTIALYIAAIGLSLMKYYSGDTMMFLISSAKSGIDGVSARALSTLVLALSRWSDIVASDTRIVQALQSLSDIDGMPEDIRKVVKIAVRTRDTDRISRKMQQEVIPGLMQFGPDIIKRLKETSEESSFSDIEANPEWEEILQDSGLGNKLRELSEMQADGADVMMVPFSNLKNYPFFRQIRNWFLPFTVQHPMLRSLHSVDDDGVSSLLEMNGMMCDSDKYSFAFSLASMPESQRSMVLSQMHAQTEQMKEQMQELRLLKAGKEFEDEITRYFRDLYRFHKLFPKRAEFYDPFAKALDFSSIPVVSDIMNSADDVATIAEFYFKRGYYSDALPLLLFVARESADSPHVWEKIGFCLEKKPDGNSEAIEAYMKAQLFNPDSKWIARRLAICWRRAGDFKNAIEYFNLARPDDNSYDRSLSLLIADTLYDAGKWDDALRELYRVDYENPGDSEILRRMAMCAFRSGDMAKADEWMIKIPNLDLSEEDYRLMGHIAFINKDIPEAMRRYRMTVRPNDEKRLWKSSILSDAGLLEGLGASRSDLLLLLDSLAYSLE